MDRTRTDTPVAIPPLPESALEHQPTQDRASPTPSSGPRGGEPEAFRPVFLVGCERSGTTLLATILGRHPRVSMPPETGYCWHLARTPPPQGTDLDGVLSWAAGIPRFADLGVSAADLARAAHGVDAPGLDPRGVVLRAMLEAFASGERTTDRPKDVIAEKSPVHLFSYPVLRRWFPAARFLCVVRDGRDVVESLAKVPWTSGEPREMHARQWRLCMRVTRHMSETLGADALVLRYEDLLARPEAVLTRACAFIGVAFDPEMLAPRGEESTVPGWEAGWKDKATRELDPSRALAWKRTMEPRAARWLSMLMRPELARWGYEPGTASGLSERARHAILARVCAPIWDVRVTRRRTGARSLRAAQRLA
ncbi:MAG: sulfotransferase [Phycisphaerales bacterium]|nr:sulfotransferase [Phycisphaerales bacterium]